MDPDHHSNPVVGTFWPSSLLCIYSAGSMGRGECCGRTGDTREQPSNVG